ncbi:SSU ribosomal protein S17P [Nitrosomonas eutropha]|uniref:Small ribosomal subunit protein uS17 n=1 Tax=Nitrosomonas eutropha TaxID=916 RepID=A0A1I7J104_9PROT|nr:30S ribosomal protein S17 [Nitrosomonas eutropha]SFU78832.1 SSU ribosomal protein S17P [Nitrosomonas eutropha]
MNLDNQSKYLIGQIISDKRDKTVTVRIDRKVKHPLYGKIITRSKKYHAHDEYNQYKVGDVVAISEARPISKTKSWQVIKVVKIN